MQIRKILHPTDFSDGSEEALKLASSLARDNHAKLLLVHVREPDSVYIEGLAAVYAEKPLAQRGRELLESVEPPVPQLDVERRLLTGSPAKALLDLIESDTKVDLVVMSTHGRAGVSRVLMGSVAEAVVRDSRCPVLTIKQPNEASIAS